MKQVGKLMIKIVGLSISKASQKRVDAQNKEALVNQNRELNKHYEDVAT
jgi:hypothetical protein